MQGVVYRAYRAQHSSIKIWGKLGSQTFCCFLKQAGTHDFEIQQTLHVKP